MTRSLIVRDIGPGATVQDQGRPGFLAYGLSRGGAADRLALAEGAALLGQDPSCGALELPGMGGLFEATEDVRIAVTGAEMRASIDGARIAWNASHLLPKGAQLMIGPALSGSYGYLHLGGGIRAPQVLGARSAHLAAGIGQLVAKGDTLEVGKDPGGPTGLGLAVEDRFGGGLVRIVPSLQTDLFADDERARFQSTPFQRDARGNRMGVRLAMDGAGFHSEAGLSVLSEVIVPGDIQITGDGAPFILLAECQTTGGYPRIGSVIPADLPRVAQTRPGEQLRFQFVSLEDAVAIQTRFQAMIGACAGRMSPLVRDPASLADLLSYQLISGVTAGDEMERGEA